MQELPAPKILMQGASGDGKTFQTTFLSLMPEMELFYLFTEQGMDVFSVPNLPQEIKDKLGKTIHYCYIPAFMGDDDAGLKQSETVNKLSYEAITQTPETDKGKMQEFNNVHRALRDYTCDCCKKSFGSVALWGTKRALIIDSLSGLNDAARTNTIGNKVTMSQGQWGIAMNLLAALLKKVTRTYRCWVVLIAHEAREVDEVTGKVKVFPDTLGKKLGPVIGRDFSEVFRVMLSDDGNFSWQTISSQACLKTRFLPRVVAIPAPHVKNRAVNPWRLIYDPYVKAKVMETNAIPETVADIKA